MLLTFPAKPSWSSTRGCLHFTSAQISIVSQSWTYNSSYSSANDHSYALYEAIILRSSSLGAWIGFREVGGHSTAKYSHSK